MSARTSVDDPRTVGAGELDTVREAMIAALDVRDGTIAGTSLIGLEQLSRTHDEFDRDAILSTASDIAADEHASSASRMTALRMSSLTGGDQTTADTARFLAQMGETVLLRSAAIVTLGEIGTEADRELLESYVQNEDQQIAHAAQLALEKMDDPPGALVDLPKSMTTSETTISHAPAQKLPPVRIN